jgi:hypothetical protein
VIALYVLAVLIVMGYSSNFLVMLLMVTAIVGAVLFLDAQMSVYVSSGVVGLVMALHYMNAITSTVVPVGESI